MFYFYHCYFRIHYNYYSKNYQLLESLETLRNLFRIKKENKAIKGRIIRDIRSLFEHKEEENYYKPVLIMFFFFMLKKTCNIFNYSVFHCFFYYSKNISYISMIKKISNISKHSIFNYFIFFFNLERYFVSLIAVSFVSFLSFFNLKRFLTSLIMFLLYFYLLQACNCSSLYVVKKIIF